MWQEKEERGGDRRGRENGWGCAVLKKI